MSVRPAVLLLLLACREAPVDPLAGSVVVDVDGGVFAFGDARVEVPRYAVSEPTRFRLVETDLEPDVAYDGVSSVWRAEPEGLEFAVDVRVTLPFDGDPERPLFVWNGERVPTAVVSDGEVTGYVRTLTQGFVGELRPVAVERPVAIPPLDVLFAVDRRASMYPFESARAGLAPPVIAALDATGRDYHLGVVAPDMNDPEHGGQLIRAMGKRVVTPDTVDPVSVFEAMVFRYLGTAAEARSAVWTAFEDDLPTNTAIQRQTSERVIVFVSAGDDMSRDATVSLPDFEDWLARGHVVPGDTVAHVVIKSPAAPCPNGDIRGRTFERYADLTGGVIGDVCGDWGTQLATVIEQHAVPTPVVGIDAPAWRVTEVARVTPGGPEVTYDSSTWRHEPGSAWIALDPATDLGPDDVMRVRYIPE